LLGRPLYGLEFGIPSIHIPPELDRHLPTGRITLEKVIAWCIEYGAPTSCDTIEALDCLTITEASPLLYRSSTDSPEQAGQR
jgi:hypothetical protein